MAKETRKMHAMLKNTTVLIRYVRRHYFYFLQHRTILRVGEVMQDRIFFPYISSFYIGKYQILSCTFFFSIVYIFFSSFFYFTIALPNVIIFTIRCGNVIHIRIAFERCWLREEK